VTERSFVIAGVVPCKPTTDADTVLLRLPQQHHGRLRGVFHIVPWVGTRFKTRLWQRVRKQEYRPSLRKLERLCLEPRKLLHAVLTAFFKKLLLLVDLRGIGREDDQPHLALSKIHIIVRLVPRPVQIHVRLQIRRFFIPALVCNNARHDLADIALIAKAIVVAAGNVELAGSCCILKPRQLLREYKAGRIFGDAAV